jgi:integrase
MQRIKIGSTATLSLQQAIAEAARLKHQITTGGDPAGERRAVIAARTAAAAVEAAKSSNRELIALWGVQGAARGVTAGAVQDDSGQVTRGLEAVGLLDIPPDALAPAHIEAIINACPVKSRATRFAALHRYLRWALRRIGSDKSPPTAQFSRHERPKPNPPRARVLAGNELRAIWTAAEAAGGIEQDLTQFLMAVPCRRGEAIVMLWKDLDIAAGTWDQPTSKNGLPHRFYLPELAFEVLQRRRRAAGVDVSGDALVFTAESGQPFTTWSHLKRRIDAATPAGEIIARWTLHDLRRTYATTSAEVLGADDGLIDLSINHAASKTRSRVTGTYNLAEKREARQRLMSSWNRWLSTAVGITGGDDAEIVPLRAAG